jgi:hypothetical protein
MDLEAIRSELMALPLLGPALLHGDVHTGKVLLRKRDGKLEPVFMDWGANRLTARGRELLSSVAWFLGAGGQSPP